MNMSEYTFNKKDITQNVEIIENTIKKFGVEIKGIRCSVEKEDEGYAISTYGEIFSNENLNNDFRLKIAYYDDMNRVLGQEIEYIYIDRFVEFDTFSFYSSELFKIPKKIKIFAVK